MALAKGTNSYVTLSEANAYLLDRFASETWSTSTDPNREKALISATSLLDELEWLGVQVDESQALAFPRSGTYYDKKKGRYTELANTVPICINNATCELALHLLNNSSVMNLSDSVVSLSVGTINLETIRQTGRFPSSVKNSIKHLLTNGGGRMWWRAN